MFSSSAGPPVPQYDNDKMIPIRMGIKSNICVRLRFGFFPGLSIKMPIPFDYQNFGIIMYDVWETNCRQTTPAHYCNI